MAKSHLNCNLHLFTPEGSPHRVAHQLLALAGMIGAMAGFLGLLWGSASTAASALRASSSTSWAMG